jgi:hypothetical protein
VAVSKWRDGTTATSLARALGPRGGVVVAEAIPSRSWDAVAAISRRSPVLVVFEESASRTVTQRGRVETFDTQRRATDARRALGDEVPFVGVDSMRDDGAMPPTNVVVDASGRVLFASQDVELVGDVAELLLRR